MIVLPKDLNGFRLRVCQNHWELRQIVDVLQTIKQLNEIRKVSLTISPELMISRPRQLIYDVGRVPLLETPTSHYGRSSQRITSGNHHSPGTYEAMNSSQDA